jgi:DnaJ-class molecular chaperone
MAKDRRDYLKDLGFHMNANPTHDELKKAWKELCKKHHPDKGGDVEEFRKVTHAFKMLTDLSYSTKNTSQDRIDLNIKIQFPISFEEAFTGKKVVMSYGVTELGTDGKPIFKENVEVETVTFDIPEGSFRPRQFAVDGKGIRMGDKRGDAEFVPMVMPHAIFTAVERPTPYGYCWDIQSKKMVPLHAMLVGDEVDVLTMKGVHKLKIPPGSAPGNRLRIPGQGCSGGDHVVVLEVMFPDARELRTKKWANLKINWDEKKADPEEEEFNQLFERTQDEK